LIIIYVLLLILGFINLSLAFDPTNVDWYLLNAIVGGFLIGQSVVGIVNEFNRRF
jgi:hypothetical protein